MIDVLDKLKGLWNASYENYIQHLTPFDYFIYFLGIVIIVILIDLFHKIIRDAISREKFNPKIKTSPMMEYIIRKHRAYKNHKLLSQILNYMSTKYMAFNNNTVETNEYYATASIFIMIRLYALMYLVLVFTNQLWYVTLSAVILLTITFAIIYFMLGSIASTRVDNMLPELSKMLSNRYANSSSIITSIEITRTDYSGAMRRELDKIYDALKKNDQDVTKINLQAIKNQYNNRNFSMVIDLVYQAYYRGNREHIIKSFTEARSLISQANMARKKITKRTRPLMGFSIFFVISGLIGMSYGNSKIIEGMAMTATESQNQSLAIVAMLSILGILLIYLGLQERSNQI